MSNEDDDRQDDQDEAPAYGEGLWGEVRFWLDAILSVFGDLKELAHVGLTRSLAVKLCNWLWGVEGALRRLILSEALKLDPARLAEARPRTGAPAESRPPNARRPSFRIFGFAGPQAGPAPASAEAPRAGLPDAWHIRFPADPLLSIGERESRPERRTAALRRTNPLDRRGSISRYDPDYVGKETDEAALLGLSPRQPSQPSRPRPGPMLAQDRPGYLFQRSDSFDWKRVEEEWKRVIPAPSLAGRILALARAMDRREDAIARVARFFQRRRQRLAAIFDKPAPQLSWPRRARSIYRCREVEDLVPQSHAQLACLDTS